jgi:hypothetical protein
MIRLLFACLTAVAQPSEVDLEMAEDIAFLRAANLHTDGPALLDYLRKQTLQGGERQKIAGIVSRLDDKALKKREQAAADLLALGPKALPVLRGALLGAPLEMRLRIERCIKELEKLSPAQTAGAAVRLVKHYRPAGAAEVLLDYMTSAPDDTVDEEIVAALSLVGVKHGQPHPLFQATLTDPWPAKRATAALVLGRYGNRNQRATVHLLLDDPHPLVRLRAAEGLLLGRDRSALSALIALLVKTPLPIAEQAEDLLMEVAGKTAPAVALGENAEARTKCYQAWREWWQLHEKKINLARMDLDTLANNDTVAKARLVAKQFILAAFRGDKIALRKTSEVPFLIAGIERIETREAWDQLLAQIPNDAQAAQTTFTVKKVMTVEEYSKNAQPEERAFVDKMKKMPVRVVVGLLDEGGQNRLESFALFVRVTGARVRVVGLGAPRPADKV